MNDAATSLSNLREIVQPPPVPWWPLAPGWWALIAILSACGCVAVVKAATRWHRNAYRRQALRELETADNDAEVARILKRTALSIVPRDQVASLSGSRWHRWLDQTGGRPLPESVAEQLTRGVYSDGNPQKSIGLQTYAAAWIRTHRRPKAC